jgi:Fe2+ or Zn2+ uptake regulation protein
MPELRRAILEAARSTTIHPPAYWIHQQVKPQFPQTSIRSVCRHLGILKNEGDILELNFGEGFKRFDGNTEPHCHFFCQQCSGVYDIFQPAEKLVDLTEIQNMGYQVLDPNLQLRGICKNCQVG